MKNKMRACSVVEIITPKKVLLNGLWFGPAKPKRAIIWVHGLGSSAFSKLDIVQKLADKNTAVMIFNNRGHDKISRIARAGEKRIGKTVLGGSAHEVFTDCADDIQGAINFVKRAGVKNIWLVGHSTGCQKSIYWASRKGRGVKGIVLLAPISDYSAEMYLKGKRKITLAVKAARALVAKGKKHELLPSDLWTDYFDAQRFLSLYTPESREEMFTYAQPKKIPRLLQSVKLPILAVFAGQDEFADRPAIDIAEWFERNTEANLETLVVPSAPHSFHGKETQVSTAIKDWIGGQ
ncbi:MAG: alpha/beta fold hydrolase [Candidatus Kaiserbacteria bacterium]|nr:alpha/beta fold hydrolase [Candidatus Kaiserbacteria bacterium]